MSNINANPPVTHLPALPTVAVVDSFVLKVALVLMAASSLILTGVATLDHFAGPGSSPVVNPTPNPGPSPIPQPLPNPWGPSPQPIPTPSPAPQPQPQPQPAPAAATLTVAAPGQTLIRVRVGSGPNSKIGFAAITFDQPGTYPVALEVVSDPANAGDGSQ